MQADWISKRQIQSGCSKMPRQTLPSPSINEDVDCNPLWKIPGFSFGRFQCGDKKRDNGVDVKWNFMDSCDDAIESSTVVSYGPEHLPFSISFL